MSATLSRVNLYEALTNAARVADKSGKLAFAKFARIEAKATDRNVMITTFNGQTAIESILAGDVADDMLAYLDTETLLRLVTAMPEGAITLTLKSNELLITTRDGKQKHNLKIGADVEIPVIAGSTKTSMARISGIELRRLCRAVKFASTNEGQPSLMTVHVAFNKPDEKTVVVVASATDGFAAVQSLAPAISCTKSAVGKAITFPASFVALLLEAVRPDDQVEIHRSGENRFIVAATNDKSGKNLALASTESAAVPPVKDIAEMIKSTKDKANVTIEVETAALVNALEIIGAYSNGDKDPANLFLAIQAGVIRYASNPTDKGQCRAVLDGTVAGPDTSRWFAPSIFRKAVSLMPEKTRAVLSTDPAALPMLFVGDNVRIMVAPLAKSSQPEVEFDEATAIELPIEMKANAEAVAA
jgi:hypothetical protein